MGMDGVDWVPSTEHQCAWGSNEGSNLNFGRFFGGKRGFDLKTLVNREKEGEIIFFQMKAFFRPIKGTVTY